MSAVNIYIVAGEPSGDRHAAGVAQALRRAQPGVIISGVGGRHLREAGQDQLFDLAEHAVVGLVDVLRHYFKFRRFFYQVLADIAARSPDVVVLVDFPGFNLRLARELRRRHPTLRLVYYIAPQVWAWKSGRARQMEEVLDLLLVIFPFEVDWFKQHAPRLPVRWVGHPTLEEWDQSTIDPWESRQPILLLLPGSRRREIEAHLPVFLEAAARLHPVHPELRFLLLTPDSEKAELARRILRNHPDAPPIQIEDGYHMNRLGRARLAWVASGTATLECAMAGLPMLVIYKTQALTWWIGRRLVKLPWLSMVNVVAGEKVVAEFLQSAATPEAFDAATRALLASETALPWLHADLVELTANLKGPGAAEHSAQAILQILQP